jgi:acid phosphatase (class A)
MVKRMIRPWIFATALTLLAVTAVGQQFERESPPAGEAKPQPYLISNKVDFHSILAPPPAAGSLRDREDEQTAERWQSVTRQRWHSAELDSDFVYPRFDEAFGRPIDRKTSPVLITLLNRALRDVSYTTFAAKEHFQRPRPYQRVQLKHVCGEVAAPKPETHPMGGSSYPSGHSAYGWAVAMILARVAPDRAELLLARATEYAESRVICGVHFPSDVDAGYAIAAAVLAHLDSSPDFQADLADARAELSPR